MITPAHVRTMAHYNRWQNRSLYNAASTLTDEARKAERGAFFGSIHATLNHLLWADQIWMSRLAGTPPPSASNVKASVSMLGGWSELRTAREAFDETIIGWAERLEDAALAGDLTWFSGAAGRELTKSRWLLVTHMFNHQTHHRGQVHCLLTQCGANPEDTDLPLLKM